MARLTIVDQSLRDFEGHNLDYARIATEEAGASGRQVRILANASFQGHAQFPDHTDIVLAFPHGLKEEIRSEHNAARLWLSRQKVLGPVARFAGRRARGTGLMGLRDDEQLLMARARAEWPHVGRVLRAATWTDGERVLFPNLTWPQAIVLADNVRSGAVPLVHWHAVLRFDPPRLASGRRAMRRALEACGDRICWWSDTRPLADAYETLCGQPFKVAKIPMDEAAARAALDMQPQPEICIGYFGESRYEKGFAVLPASISKALVHDSNLRFSIQVMPSAAGDYATLAAIDALRELRSPLIQLIEGPLDGQSLARAIAAAQVCLLPYQSSAYRLRSSGLLMQAILMDRVVVGPAGDNWLHRELQTQGAPFVLVDDHGDLAEAILSAAALARARPRHSRPAIIKSQVSLSAPWLA